jgi:hypothetical protein
MDITETTKDGWRALTFSANELAVTIFPDHGAEIASLVHTPTDTEMLYQSAWGRPGPADPPLEGAGTAEFLQRYAGGWQELFPNAGDPTSVDGIDFPFHGEAATASWIVDEHEGGIRARFTSSTTGLELTRVMRFADTPATLILNETVANSASNDRHFTWGHHLVLGAPFLDAGCRLDLPVTWGWIPSLPGDAHRLEPTERFTWPNAIGRDGLPIDLRDVPGPEVDSHDGLYMTGLESGYLAAENPQLGMRFEISFDPHVFPWVTLWMPYGGLHEPPLKNMYGVGIEPWRTPLPLAEAIEAGEALLLAPGKDIQTELRVQVSEISVRPRS